MSSNARKLANLIVESNVKVADVDSDISNTVSTLKSRFDSDDTKLQSLSTFFDNSVTAINIRLDSDDAKLQSLDAAIAAGLLNLADSDLIISQLEAKISAAITNVDSDSAMLQNISTRIQGINARLDSDESKLQSLDTNIVQIRTRLDSDETAIQAAKTLVVLTASSAGITDSDLKVVADLRNEIDSEILYVRNLNLSYTNYTYIATAGQTTFTDSDANSLTLAYTVGAIQVFLNGVVLGADDFTATDGTSVVLVEAAKVSAQLTIIVPKLESNYNPYVAPNWSTGTQQAKLLTSITSGAPYLASSVGLDNIGNTMIAGAPGEGNKGTLSIYTRSGSTWSLLQKIANPTPSSAYDAFSDASAISGDGNYIIAGAYGWFNSSTSKTTGVAHIFKKSGSTWSLDETLLSGNTQNDQWFGRSVAIDGDATRVVVGAPRYDNPTKADAGKAFVFVRSGSTWSQEAAFFSDDFASIGTNPEVFKKIAINSTGDTIVAGAQDATGSGSWSGVAYIFTRSGTTWSQQAKILPSTLGSADDYGSDVDISDDGNTVVVGSMYDDDNGTNGGAAYVWTRSGTTWTEQQKLLASDLENSAFFGTAVSISGSGDSIAVGSWGLGEDANDQTGRAYVFQLSGGTWSQVKALNAATPESGSSFGKSIAFNQSGSTCAIGAPESNNGASTQAGAVYAFTA